MALSYLQDTQIDAGLLIGQPLDMKQVVEKQTSLNNNTQTLFSAIGADAAAEVSILTPQQLLAASQTAAFMAAGLPVSLHSDMLAKSSLYHRSFFNAWPATASSPPSSLHHSPATMPPITRSAVRRNNGVSVNNNNNNNNTNNNNTTPGANSIDKKSHVTNKKSGSVNKAKTRVAAENAVMARVVASFRGGPSGRGSLPGKGGGAVVRTAARGTGRKAFRCPICLKSFGYKHVLQNHERTHTGEKPFECMECHKRFTRDHHLKTHMRLHTGEKPYHCSHCERQFVQVANLRRHLRVHTGERPYACDVCSSKFSDSNQLKAHSLIHKGEKPFECQTCQMRFRRRHHLMHHKCGAGPQSGIDARSPVNSSSEASNADDGEDSVNTGGGEMMEVELAVSSANSVVAPARIPVTQYQPPSPAIGSTSRSIPLNLPVISLNLPEQTEPEDLSMSTGMHRLQVTNDDNVEMSDATQRRTQQTLDSKVYAYDSTSGLIVRESLRTKCNHLSATKRKSKVTIAKICRSS